MLSAVASICLMPRTVLSQELTVAVASNFYHALSVISQKFEQETGTKVRLSSGASGLLYAQIIRGAPFDLFFSADVERPKLLEQKGLTSVRENYVYGRLALWAPQQALSKQKQLKHQSIVNEHFLATYEQRLAIANPRLAPYGKAAKQTLAYMGLSEKFNAKSTTNFVLGNNINQTYQFIDSGNAKAGFVAYSLLKAKPVADTDYWLIPQNHHEVIEQQVVVLTNAKKPVVAKKFLDYILSPPIQKLLTDMGYGSIHHHIKNTVLGDG
ncbi:molybdate-binding periplasmic protein ModA [Thalassotalea profundi]|uniref:Molybdate-binding periplasmic protein ModA n=1 Tax=Thalassotalea profundi TaxID=2036687 RepID=A0ABQ3J0E5_9GAMM|nr:molybdate-binding periplasmic protein ModA [Thalassotalea profundi]